MNTEILVILIVALIVAPILIINQKKIEALQNLDFNSNMNLGLSFKTGFFKYLFPSVLFLSIYLAMVILPSEGRLFMLICGSPFLIIALIGISHYFNYWIKNDYDSIIYNAKSKSLTLINKDNKKDLMISNIKTCFRFEVNNKFNRLPWFGFTYLKINTVDSEKILINSLMFKTDFIELLLINCNKNIIPIEYNTNLISDD